MNYAVIGTGGIGGYYGARLAAAGKEVSFLLRSDYEQVRDHGLRVDSVKGDIFLPTVNAYKSAGDMPKTDVVLVCLKTGSNSSIPELIRPILGPESVVVLIQNGLGMERDLSEAMPEARIIGATAFICSSKVAPGHIEHTGYGELTLAPFSDGLSPALEAIVSDMEASGVPCHLCPSLELMRWKKLVWNIPYNGMSVTENCRTDVLTFEPALRGRVIALMHEVIAAAGACGVEIPEDFVGAMVSSTENMEPYYPSMFLDHAAGRRMEIESIYARPVAEAWKHGFDMPLTREVMRGLRESEGLHEYDMGPGVEAFSTTRDALLPYPVVQAHQTHGVEVALIDRPDITREELEGIDAMMTDNRGIAIGARTADCIPVLMYDPVRQAVAAVHSGWRGTVARIVSNAIEALSINYGTKAEDLRVVIGPGIQKASFQVGEEVATAFKQAGFPLDRVWSFDGPQAPSTSDDAPKSMAGGHHIDLVEAIRFALSESGVPEENVTSCGIDTFLTPEFFSARREGFHCGRIINAIRLL